MDRLLLMAAGAGLFVAGLLTKEKGTAPVLTDGPDSVKPPGDGNTKSVPTNDNVRLFLMKINPSIFMTTFLAGIATAVAVHHLKKRNIIM